MSRCSNLCSRRRRRHACGQSAAQPNIIHIKSSVHVQHHAAFTFIPYPVDLKPQDSAATTCSKHYSKAFRTLMPASPPNFTVRFRKFLMSSLLSGIASVCTSALHQTPQHEGIFGNMIQPVTTGQRHLNRGRCHNEYGRRSAYQPTSTPTDSPVTCTASQSAEGASVAPVPPR